MYKLVRPLLAVVLLSANAHGQGTVLWDEAANGQLSQDSSMPTSLTPLRAGTNSVIGATEIVPATFGWNTFADFFTIQVPSNLVVSAIYLSIDKPSVWTWVGEPNFINQIGFSFSPSSGELLTQLGIGSLGPNTYGMYLENHDSQTTTSVANYRLEFFTQSVPEPGTISLFVIGAGFLGFRHRKKFR